MTLERGTLLRNRYRIIEILGQGGMGSVYRAVDENLGVDVAVKENLFTTDEYARQFRLEAVILANLRHPNLTRVTDHFVIGDQGQYLVMDYIEGEDLRQRMERTETLPDDDVILIGAAMCKALSYLHTRKPSILHRDVKPGNVKISPDGEVFLVDFGLAKVVQGSQVTTTGARAMTPGYSPPEQYGTARTDPRTDIYSLGATLYAALTGVIPEDGLARAMENTELTPIRKRVSKVSRRLASAIEKAMEVDADDRFQTAEEFRKALLSANSKTQRLIDYDFAVTPPPSEPVEPSIEKAPSASEEIPSVGVSLSSKRSSSPTITETPRQKRRKQRRKFIRFLLWMILIAGGLATTALYPSQILNTLSGWGLIPASPTATMTESATVESLAIESATIESVTASKSVEVIAEVTLTPTIEPSPTNTLEPMSTPTSENTPTSIPTPLGGGAGQIAFVSDRAGTAQIYIIDSNGKNARPITNLPSGACQPDWSPDGAKIVFVSPCEVDQDSFKGSSLYIIDEDGTNLTQLPTIPGGDFEPAWSPDGKKIAFTSLRDGYMQIYAMNLDDQSVTRLIESSKGNNEFARQPAWSPFGNQIAYAFKRYSAYQIWIMSDTGESQEPLTRDQLSLWNWHPLWSPKGEIILYDQHAPETPYKVWLMSILYKNRGSAGIAVEAKPLPIRNADYSQDGFWIIFEGKENNNRDVFIMTAVGASREQITSDPANDFDPVWRPMP